MIYILFSIVIFLLLVVAVILWNRVTAKERQIDELNQQSGLLGQHLAEEQLGKAVLEERLTTSDRQRREMIDQRDELLKLFSKEREVAGKQFTDQFQLMANEILEAKSRSMHTKSSDTITALLQPFGEKIDKFRERIENESKQRFALESEVKRLAELNLKMSQEANNLTAALKGSSKTQGDWGEMILETLLENSGLQRGQHFRVQDSLRDGQGRLLRPDVVINMPDGKEVVIDSKVSLTAYVTHCEAENDESAKRALAAHIASVRNHIRDLGQKSYHELVSSPDFVIMFIPNEPAFLLALQGDNSLWQEAYQKGVVLSSPTNLFAILRIVDDLWRRDLQSKNALEIARQGGDLYDKFVGFAETLSEMGRSIKKSDELYQKGISQLTEGRGNLVRRVERLRELGLKTSKDFSEEFLQGSDTEIEDENFEKID